MYDPSGDTEPEDVTNPANYLVVGAGADGDFSTDMCGPVFGDDVVVDVQTVVYDTPTTTAQLQVDILPDEGAKNGLTGQLIPERVGLAIVH